MKILQLCLRVPFPPRDGGAIAMHNLSEALTSNNHEVKILAFNTKKHHVEFDELPSNYKSIYSLECVPLDAKVRVWDGFLNLFSDKSLNVSRFDVQAMHDKLKAILEQNEFSLILIESLFMIPYVKTIRKYSKAKIVYRAHNIEHVIWKRLAIKTANPIRRLYLAFLANRLKKYETGVLNDLDAIITLTTEDSDWFIRNGFSKGILVSPVSLDVSKYNSTPISNSFLNIFHLGSMDWMPNVEAVDWFLENVWPLVENRHPGLVLHLAGKGMPQKYFALNSSTIKVYGYIDDLNAFMDGKQLMVVPLLSGSGMRVKILEGMASGRTIISSTIGAEGIDVSDGFDILIADDPDAFVRQITKCLTDQENTLRIALNARKTASEKYDKNIVGQQLSDFLDKTADTSA